LPVLYAWRAAHSPRRNRGSTGSDGNIDGGRGARGFDDPGAVEAGSLDKDDPEHIANHFFKTLEESKADAVLLDLTASSGQGVATIRRIRRRSAVPIIVVCILKTRWPPIMARPARPLA